MPINITKTDFENIKILREYLYKINKLMGNAIAPHLMNDCIGTLDKIITQYHEEE